jgi:hypothetical protein
MMIPPWSAALIRFLDLTLRAAADVAAGRAAM